jgi:hypothetical protein
MCANVSSFTPPKENLKFFCGNIVAQIARKFCDRILDFIIVVELLQKLAPNRALNLKSMKFSHGKRH